MDLSDRHALRLKSAAGLKMYTIYSWVSIIGNIQRSIEPIHIGAHTHTHDITRPPHMALAFGSHRLVRPMDTSILPIKIYVETVSALADWQIDVILIWLECYCALLILISSAFRGSQVFSVFLFRFPRNGWENLLVRHKLNTIWPRIFFLSPRSREA